MSMSLNDDQIYVSYIIIYGRSRESWFAVDFNRKCLYLSLRRYCKAVLIQVLFKYSWSLDSDKCNIGCFISKTSSKSILWSSHARISQKWLVFSLEFMHRWVKFVCCRKVSNFLCMFREEGSRSIAWILLRKRKGHSWGSKCWEWLVTCNACRCQQECCIPQFGSQDILCEYLFLIKFDLPCLTCCHLSVLIFPFSAGRV